ncbi:hypothetical protein Tco_1290271, partial [Tanacetum coccineum]
FGKILSGCSEYANSAVIVDDTTEGEKIKKAKDANPATTQGEHL